MLQVKVGKNLNYSLGRLKYQLEGKSEVVLRIFISVKVVVGQVMLLLLSLIYKILECLYTIWLQALAKINDHRLRILLPLKYECI